MPATACNAKTTILAPEPIDRIGAEVGRRFDDREYWITCFDRDSMFIADDIRRMYYRGTGTEDFYLGAVDWMRNRYVWAATRKRWMPARDYSKLLWKKAKHYVSERELLDRDCLLIVRPQRMSEACLMWAYLMRGRLNDEVLFGHRRG